MANIKISELEEYTQAKDNDLLVIVDTTNNETKKIQAGNLGTGGVDIPIQDTAPTNPKSGDFYVDTADNSILKYYQNEKWNDTNITGDTLPIGAIVEYDGTTVPTGYEKVSDGNFSYIYSTSEQIVGKDENGKNVYKRTFSGTTSDTLNSTTITTDYSGKNIVVKSACGSIYNPSGGGVNVGGYVNENFYCGLYLHENELQIYYGNACKNYNYNITIEFTKVSD